MRILSITCVWLAAGAASAQPRAVAVTAPATSEGVEDGFANAVGQLVRETVGGLPDVTLVGAPDMSLEDLQLARGCLGETIECLRPVASDLDAEALVLPSLDRAGGSHVLTLVRYSAADDGLERVVRRGEAEGLLDGVRAQVHELFGLPAPEPPPDATDEDDRSHDVEPPDGETNGSVRTSPSSSGPGAAPLVVAGLGVAALGVGVLLGLMSSSAQSEYDDVAVSSTADADRARDAFERGETQALVANASFGVGAALVVGGVLWLVLGGGDSGSREQSVSAGAAVAPGGAGLVARGAF